MPQSRRDMGQISETKRTVWHVALIATVAAAFRLPIWLTRVHQTFDEGVFLASNDLVAAGHTPFQEVFSSQGPLFLPLLRLGQWLSFEDPRGPRTTMILAAIGFTVAFYFIARAYLAPTTAVAASLLVATSGVGILAAGPVQSEGIALALGMTAIAILVRCHRWWAPHAAGIAIGAALAVKSLHVLPLLAVVVFLLLRRRDFKALLSSGGVAVATVLAVSLPFGLDRVWDQYVLFHLAKDNTVAFWENLSQGAAGLWSYDLPLLVGVVAALGYRWVTRSYRPGGVEGPVWLPALWLLATALLFTVFTPVGAGFTRALVYLVPPLLLTVVPRVELPGRALIALVLAGVLWQVATVGFIGGTDPDPEQEAVIQVLDRVPASGLIVTDDPGLAWATGRLSHPTTVDPSFARINTGYLTMAGIEAALVDPESCAYVVYSGRFEGRSIRVPSSYQATSVDGVLVRSGC